MIWIVIERAVHQGMMQIVSPSQRVRMMMRRSGRIDQISQSGQGSQSLRCMCSGMKNLKISPSHVLHLRYITALRSPRSKPRGIL